MQCLKVKYYLSSFHLCWSLGIYGMVISGTRGALAVPSWLYDLFCAEQNVKVIIIGVSFLALVLYSLNTRPSLKAMLKYEGCERL
jgi:hypothetical protein